MPTLNYIKDQVLSPDFENRHKSNPEDFTRKRTWGFATTFVSTLLGAKKSLTVYAHEFLSGIGIQTGVGASKQAFSQARQKLKPEGFIELNTSLQLQYYMEGDFKTFKGYRLLAIDGSDIHLPNAAPIIERFGLCSGLPMASASILYDPLNHIVLDAVIDPYLGGDERRQANVHIEKTSHFEGISNIFIFDRGYPEMALICKVISRGDDIVLRFCPKHFIKQLYKFADDDMPLDNLVDVNLNDLSRTAYAKVSGYKSTLSDKLKLRVIRLPRTGSEDIFLLTTLTNTEQFPYDCFEEIYHLRWGVETRYDYLKGPMEIENFSSKIPDGILQEFHATILSANINQLVIEASEDVAFEKHKPPNVEINKSTGAGLTRGVLLKAFFSNEPMEVILNRLIKEVARNKVTSIPGRSFPRKVKPAPKFSMNRRRIS